MRIAYFGLALALAIPFVNSAHAKSVQKNIIVCNESEPDDSGIDSLTVGRYTIHLDATGNASKVEIKRAAFKTMDAIEQTIDLQNGQIKHGFVDQHEVLDNGLGSGYEGIQATAANGDTFLIRINDHSYAGWKGSSFSLNVGGKKMDSMDVALQGDCSGQIRFPDQKKIEFDKEMKREAAKASGKKKKK